MGLDAGLAAARSHAAAAAAAIPAAEPQRTRHAASVDAVTSHAHSSPVTPSPVTRHGRSPRGDHAHGLARAQGARRAAAAIARCTRSATRRCSASATRTRTGCSSAKVRARTKTRRASRSSARPGRLLDNMLAAIELEARRERLHRECRQMPPARQPQSRARRGAEVRAVPAPPDRADQAEADRRAGQVAAVNLLATRRQRREPARAACIDYSGMPLIVTYHPAYLLRSLTEKAKAGRICASR